jgi:hypothetical protein
MPSRRQRRRRDKSFRHEYETLLLDEEGNETPLAELREERDKQRADKKPAKTSAKGGARPQRAMREPPVPTWRRAFRRGGLMGGAIFVAFVFVLHGGSTASRAAIASIYAVAFIPLTYWVDRIAYRSFQKRMAKAEAKKS